MKKLIKKCKELGYDFNVQMFDGDFNIYITNPLHQIDNEVITIGGCAKLNDAIEQILKKL